ncbi:MAG: response regulator transcription factor [Verrucomicrobiales bacterium]|nr:response regulator transcription factor [Verrucomicrobiales bacterium]
MNTHRLLIVEDDPALLRGVADNFSARGYHVETATDGERGLEKARRLRFDLAILDVMLPRINGYEICRYLRQEGSALPVVFVTAKGEESDVLLGLGLGADDYVRKPFGIRELLARVEAVLRRAETPDHKGGEPGEDECRFGDFVLDRGSRCLRRIGGDEVELSPKEYGLLNYLCQRAGRALSRDEIMDEVWGYDSRVTSRSIDRFVTNLRKKIETDPDHPHIETIREFGYRFRV